VRGFLRYLRELRAEYEGKIAFLFLYILEAHAQDEWPISSGRYVPDKTPIILNQHKTVQDRINACQSFIDMYKLNADEFHMALDGIENEFERYYGAWPLRFYGIHNGVLEFKPQPKDCTYSILEFIEWMKNAT